MINAALDLSDRARITKEFEKLASSQTLQFLFP